MKTSIGHHYGKWGFEFYFIDKKTTGEVFIEFGEEETDRKALRFDLKNGEIYDNDGIMVGGYLPYEKNLISGFCDNGKCSYFYNDIPARFQADVGNINVNYINIERTAGLDASMNIWYSILENNIAASSSSKSSNSSSSSVSSSSHSSNSSSSSSVSSSSHSSNSSSSSSVSSSSHSSNSSSSSSVSSSSHSSNSSSSSSVSSSSHSSNSSTSSINEGLLPQTICLSGSTISAVNGTYELQEGSPVSYFNYNGQYVRYYSEGYWLIEGYYTRQAWKSVSRSPVSQYERIAGDWVGPTPTVSEGDCI